MKIILIIILIFPLQLLSAPFEVIIETPDESIEGEHLKEKTVNFEKLSTDQADDQDVLYFTGTSWMPAPLTGLIFRGAWNPVTNTPRILNKTYEKNSQVFDAISGDYFIVNNTLAGDWNKGDWIIFNGETWERINNTGSVLSIFNRKPNVFPAQDDYRWDQIDKTGSSILDLHDVFRPALGLRKEKRKY